jgi:hypothetical protein
MVVIWARMQVSFSESDRLSGLVLTLDSNGG